MNKYSCIFCKEEFVVYVTSVGRVVWNESMVE